MKNSSRILSTSIATLLAGGAVLLGGLALLSALLSTAHGAEITFADPKNITDSSDVFKTGTSVFAYSWAPADHTVNQVVFTGLPDPLEDRPALAIEGLDMVGSNLFAATQTYLSSYPDYKAVVESGLWTASGATATVTLNELSLGHVYGVQLWVHDGRASNGRFATVSSAGGNSQVLRYATGTSGSSGQFTVGTFVADSVSQVFSLTGGSSGSATPSTQLNALQLRDLTGIWSGAINGAWDANTPNFAGGQTYAQVAALTGNVFFGDVDEHGVAVTNRTITIQPGGISATTVNLDGATAAYSFSGSDSTGLTGPATVRKSGAATATFAGTHTYTGPTILTGGVFSVDTLANGGLPSGLGQSSNAASNLVFSGSTLRYTGPTTSTDRNFQISGGKEAFATIDVVNAGTELTLTGNAEFTTPSYTGFTKIGSGTLTLTGSVKGQVNSNGEFGLGELHLVSGTLRVGNDNVFGTASSLSIGSNATFDLNGHDGTFQSVSSNAATGRITDLSSTPGTTALRITALYSPMANLITDGPIRQLSVTISTYYPFGPQTFNRLNTFSGGLTFVPSSIGTYFQPKGGPTAAVTGSPGNIENGPYGRGPITIGLTGTDLVNFSLTEAATVIANDLVINTIRGSAQTEPTAGIQVGSTGNVFSGAIRAYTDLAFISSGYVPVNLSLQGPISSGAASTGLVTKDYTAPLSLTLKNETSTPNSYTGNTIVSTTSRLILAAPEQIPHGAGKGDVIVDGQLDLAGFDQTVNGLSGSGSVSAASGTPTLTVGSAGTAADVQFFHGILQNSTGTLSLKKVGAGTFALNGTATHTGDTTIEEGTLVVNGMMTSSPVLVLAGAKLAGTGYVQGPVTIATAGAVEAGSNGLGTLSLTSLNFSGDGTMRIGSLRNYASNPGFDLGLLAVNDHQITVELESLAGVQQGATYKILTFTTPIADGLLANFHLAPLPARGFGQLIAGANELGIKFTNTDFLRWNGGGQPANEWNTATLNWQLNSNNRPTYYIDSVPDEVVFGDDPKFTQNTVWISAAPVSPSDVRFTNSLVEYTIEGANGIQGATNLTKTGTGTVTLNSPNAYTGSTTVNAGVLRIGHPTALGSVGNGTTVQTGAALEIQGGISAAAEPIFLRGTGISNQGAIRSRFGNNSLSGPITLGDGATSIQADADTLTLTAAAKIIGDSLLGNSSLTVGGVGSIAIESTVSLGKGSLRKTGPGTVSLRGPVSYFGATEILAGALEVGKAGLSAQLRGPVVNDGHLVLFLESSGKGYTSPVITGSGHVTYRTESPQLTEGYPFALNPQNAYSGGTTVSHTAVTVGVFSALGSGPVEVKDEGSVQFFNFNSAMTLANDFSLSGKGAVLNGESAGALNFRSTTTLTGNLTFSGDTRFGLENSATISGVISGPAALEVYYQFTGGSNHTLTLTGENTYTGSTTLTNASLQIGDGGTSGSIAPSSQIFNNSTLIFNRSDTLVFPNVISGKGALTKLGAGTLTLSANSTFTGATAVQNGTLNLRGALSGSPVTVQNSATLQGTGTLLKLLTIANGATLAPGEDIGELHADGGLVLAPGSGLDFDLSGTNHTPGSTVNDLVSVTGNLTLDGTLRVSEIIPGSFLAAAYGDTWTLFTYTGAITDHGLDLGSMPALAGDFEFALSLATPNQVHLTIVPEPASAALCLLAGAALLSRRIRRPIAP